MPMLLVISAAFSPVPGGVDAASAGGSSLISILRNRIVPVCAWNPILPFGAPESGARRHSGLRVKADVNDRFTVQNAGAGVPANRDLQPVPRTRRQLQILGGLAVRLVVLHPVRRARRLAREFRRVREFEQRVLADKGAVAQRHLLPE